MSENMMKIPILGLDNAGKTSLLHTLKREFNRVEMVKPTKNIERTICSFFERLDQRKPR